jgi:hypothetical protein
LQRIGGRDRREQQHRNLELQCQLRRGLQPLFVFVGTVRGHENVVFANHLAAAVTPRGPSSAPLPYPRGV